jgi:RHS repeat-associated protein
VQPVDYDNPTARWAMTKLTLNDRYNKVNDGADEYYKSFAYENGHYDRREREFYGYETVKSIDMAADNSVYRTSVSEYHNDSYFLNGLLKKAYILKGSDPGQKFSETENRYELYALDASNTHIDYANALPGTYDVGGREGRRSAIALLRATTNSLYELMPSAPLQTEVAYHYDNMGRIEKYVNVGDISDGSDDYWTSIEYHNDTQLLDKNISRIPARMLVSDNNSLMRDKSTTVDLNTGDILTQSSVIDVTASTPEYATTTMVYDGHGNMTDIVYPATTNGQMYYHYEYETTFNKYIVQTTDAYHYISSASYDERFDKATVIKDASGNSTFYTYDSFGRMTKVIAPKEVESGQKYTLAFSYYPFLQNLPSSAGANMFNFVPVAVAKHFDVQHPDNPVETYNFIDGLGRTVQVKKDINLNYGAAQDPEYKESLSISGKDYYDEFGRPVEAYHPWSEEKTDSHKFLVNEFSSPVKSTCIYDALDRVVSLTDDGNCTTSTIYDIAQDNLGKTGVRISAKTTRSDSVDLINEVYKDVSGKVVATMNKGDVELWTNMTYNALGELMSYSDAPESGPVGLTTSYGYDSLGRKVWVNHPDNGLTKLVYDEASNLIKAQTANLANDGSIPDPNDRYIKYFYEHNRLKSIIYPDTPSGSNVSNVELGYVQPGGQGAGQIETQADATGYQWFAYGNMGEMVQNIRTIIAPNMPTLELTTRFGYDSFNRLTGMVYPDGEKVAYSYDIGGNIFNITGELNGSPYSYIQRIDYDLYGMRTYMRYGNKTDTFYSYTNATRELQYLGVTASDGSAILKNEYKYDNVGNVTNMANGAGVTSNNKGGMFNHFYAYDNLNRLNYAEGYFEGDPSQGELGNDYESKYAMKINYNNTHGISSREQFHERNYAIVPENTYGKSYKYYDGTHKLESTQSGTFYEGFKYDSNGNMVYKSNSDGFMRTFYWDESDRLRVVVDNNDMQHYIYDAADERVLKASCDFQQPYSNGTILDETTLTVNAYTVYPSPFVVVDPFGGFSKHYYSGSQRIVSRVAGQSSEIFYQPSPRTAPQAPEPRALREMQKQDLQRMAGKSKRKVVFAEFKPMPEEEPDAKETPTEARAPYPVDPPPQQYIPLYFYHPDHLGSTTFLSDAFGYAYQFYLNLPFGETMAEQQPSTSYVTPYKFTGKELDEETGLHYFGGRYYDPNVSIWLSADPMAEKYPNVNPYIYSFQNPIYYVDPDGNEPTPYEAAVMAQHVYGDVDDKLLSKTGWKVSSKGMSRFKTGRMGFKANLYERKKPDGSIEYAYVYAGTDDLKDCAEDLTQSVAWAQQYDIAVRNSADLSRIFGSKTELTFVGHSLGGGLANISSLKTNRKSITFNPAWISLGTLMKYGLTKASDANITNYILKGEILNSLQSKYGKYVLLKHKGKCEIVKPDRHQRQETNTFTRHMIGEVVRALTLPPWKGLKDVRLETKRAVDNTYIYVSRSPRNF